MLLSLLLPLTVACDAGNGGIDDGGAGRDASAEDSGAGDSTVTPGQDAGTQADGGGEGCTSPTEGEPGLSNPGVGEVGHTEAAHWKHNAEAALTISFDDSTPGQARHAVPAFVARGITGTWFINPGTDPYLAYADVWEVDAAGGGQELANHSMHHSGAADYAEAEAEIGDAAAVIWAAYPPDRSPLHGFNNGGGTNWNITEAEYQGLLEQFHCVERAHSTGIPSGTLAADLFPMVRDRLMLGSSPGGWADGWGLIHFHGVCDPVVDDNGHCICTPGNPCEEYGDGVLSAAVDLNELTAFLDDLLTDPWTSQSLWIAGFIAAHKYQRLRNETTFLYVPVGPDELGVRLESSLDPTLYDEDLTLLTTTPGAWSACEAIQCGEQMGCVMENGVAVYQARLGAGDVTLTGS